MTTDIILPPNSKAIPLSLGRYAIVDDKWYDMLSLVKWHAAHTRGNYYARRPGNKPNGNVGMHRVIMDAKSSELVDHINGDTLDNRECNLRICDKWQNQHNRKPTKGRNKYKGIYRYAGRWHAAIIAFTKKHYLGGFHTPEEAALAYNKAAIRLYKEFARLNVIETTAT